MKPLYLFDPSKYEKRKTPSQKEFIQSNKDILAGTVEIVNSAFRKLHTKIFTLFKPGEMDKNMAAVSMISFIRQGYIRQFPNYCRKATKSRFKLTTPNDENIYVKKLDHNKLPSNIETENNNLILYQLSDNAKDKFPNVFFGYTTTEEYSKITGIYAVCIKVDQIVWITDITSLETKKTGIVIDIRPKTNKGVKLKEGTLRIKGKKGK